jgi:hypothetical protein
VRSNIERASKTSIDGQHIDHSPERRNGRGAASADSLAHGTSSSPMLNWSTDPSTDLNREPAHGRQTLRQD